MEAKIGTKMEVKIGQRLGKDGSKNRGKDWAKMRAKMRAKMGTKMGTKMEAARLPLDLRQEKRAECSRQETKGYIMARKQEKFYTFV